MKKKLFVFVLCAIFSFSFAAPFASAQSGGILNIWEGTDCNVRARGCGLCDALMVAQNIISYLTQIASAIAVGMVVYGALMLMVAGGSEERVKKAKKIMTGAVTGFAITLSAWVIVNTIVHLLVPEGNPLLFWNRINCT